MNAVALLALGAAWADTRRFALIAGANDGGADRVTLQYAISDAEAVGDVLADLGGIPQSNQTLLVEPTADVLRGAIDNLAQTVASAEGQGMRTEVVFYYSGHSDESGLMLGESRYMYPELKRHLEAIPADVKVVILDSCASGALVRTKGGVARPAFLEDRTNDVEGTAYVMSSSADEASQESDVVGASYFTHFLVSGMRGAADRSLDGRVTLHEAWDFAARETLERTERTSIGAQHPFFHRDLGGHGDFVFTDLTQTTSSLVFDASLEGRLFVRDQDGDLVAELAKPRSESVEVALSAGTYTVVLQQGEDRYEAVFDIGEAEHMLVDDLEFIAIDAELVRARGGTPQKAVVTPPRTPRPPDTPQGRPPPPSTREVQVELVPDGPDVSYQLGVLGAEAISVRGAQTSTVYNQADTLHGVQLSLVANVVSAASSGWQSALFVNVASAELTGVQTALINGAEHVDGVQVGLVNHAKQSRGAQIGLINSGGDGTGVQVGLVNVARDYDGAALGLLNLHRSGYNHFAVNAGYPENLLLTLSLGSRYVYTTGQIGTGASKGPAMSFAIGAGLHLPVKRFYVDLDGAVGWRLGSTVGDSYVARSGQPFVRTRMQMGVALAKHFALQTGPMLELYPQDQLPPFEVGETLLMGWTVGMRF